MSSKRSLFILLALALVLRLAWVALQSRDPDPRLGDQFEYLELGRNLLHHGQLFFHDPRFGQDVYAYRTPGYPAFVALCGGNVVAIRIVQALIDTSTVLAIFLLARRWLAPKASLFAAALVAFNPFMIYFTGLVLTETLFTAMLAWGICLIRPVRQPLLSTIGLFLIALSGVVRPSAIGLAPLVAIIAMRAAGFRWRRIALALFHLTAMMTFLFYLWAERNLHHPQLGSWIWTTTNSGITTYDGFHDAATGASDQGPFVDKLLPDLRRMTEVQRDQFFRQRAHEWIADHPARSAKLAVIKIARTWSPVPLSSDYGTSLYIAAGLLYSVPFDVLILLGLWRCALPRSVKFLLVIPAIYFTALHALSVGSLRYRLPAEPPMAVLAGSVLAARPARPRDDPTDRDPHPQEGTADLNGPPRRDNPTGRTV